MSSGSCQKDIPTCLFGLGHPPVCPTHTHLPASSGSASVSAVLHALGQTAFACAAHHPQCQCWRAAGLCQPAHVSWPLFARHVQDRWLHAALILTAASMQPANRGIKMANFTELEDELKVQLVYTQSRVNMHVRAVCLSLMVGVLQPGPGGEKESRIKP